MLFNKNEQDWDQNQDVNRRSNHVAHDGSGKLVSSHLSQHLFPGEWELDWREQRRPSLVLASNAEPRPQRLLPRCLHASVGFQSRGAGHKSRFTLERSHSEWPPDSGELSFSQPGASSS